MTMSYCVRSKNTSCKTTTHQQSPEPSHPLSDAPFVDVDNVILGNGGTGRMSSLVGPPHEFSGPCIRTAFFSAVTTNKELIEHLKREYN
jgi:hypothetical protein